MKKIMRIEDYVKENREVINDLRIASALLEKRRPIIAESLMDLAERLDDLAESEDERIRKWIANYIHRSVFDEEEYPKALKAIEYLEKQKESLRDFIDDFPYSDQKEQKPTESISHLTVKGEGVYKICPRCKERMIRDDSKVYTSMPPQYGYNCPKCGAMEFDTVIYDNPEMEEQKPVVTHGETYHVDTLGTQQVIAGKMPQKPAEWSEEDEKMLMGIIERGSAQIPPHEPALREEQMEWLMNRLKSLRPQPHWKPTKEQMEALEEVIVLLRNLRRNTDDRKNLETLREQLGKL